MFVAMAGKARAAWAVAADDRIAWVDAGFGALAIAHGVPDLPERAVGQPLLDFVAGERPRALQRHLLERARGTDEPIELRYRCDAPDLRRVGALRLAGQPDGGVILTSVFLEQEPRQPQQLLVPRARRNGRLVNQCAWCNRFDVDGWCDAEEAARRLGPGPLPEVGPAVCEICELLLLRRPAHAT